MELLPAIWCKLTLGDMSDDRAKYFWKASSKAICEMQLLSSENKNLPLKIPCKKVTCLLLERKNTSVVQKACRSCITKSASRTKSNKQQNQIYNKQTKICNKTKYTTTNCKRWKYWWITKTAVPQPFHPLQILLKNFSILDFPPQTFAGNQEKHIPKNYSWYFCVAIR